MATEKQTGRIGKYQILRALSSDLFGYLYECMYQEGTGKVKTCFLALINNKNSKTIKRYPLKKRLDLIIDQCFYNLLVKDHFAYHGYTSIVLEAESPIISISDPETKTHKKFRQTKYMGQAAAGTVYKIEKISEGYEPKKYGTGIYALNVLNPKIKPEYQALGRFRQQADIQSSLQHPHMQKIYHCCQGRGRDNNWYIVMDFKIGKSLAHYIGKISIYEAFTILNQISSVLYYVHQNEIIHRDIKPRNILYPKPLKSYLAGFFFAKRLNILLNLIRTGQGVSIGTLEYSSPEQAQGLAVDETSDMYSLGVSIYVALAGKFPFKSKNKPEMIREIASKPLPSLLKMKKLAADPHRDFLKDLDEIIQKMTKKSPKERYKNLGEVKNSTDYLLEKMEVTRAEITRPKPKPRGPVRVNTEMMFRMGKSEEVKKKCIPVVILAFALLTAVAIGIFLIKPNWWQAVCNFVMNF